jgi:DNA polymerase III subunit epsilon
MHYVIIDIETTGGSPKNSKITEIAMYKHDGISIIDEFETLINPEIPIPDFIINLTGINNEMVKNAPKFFEVAKKIVEFTEDCIFVAHNVSFDYSVIRQEFLTLGYDYRRKNLCTVIASRKIIPGHASYSLGKLTSDLGISIVGRHRAGGDALATSKLFTILNQTDEVELQNLINEDLNPKILHPNLDLAELDGIPDKSGVYKFYNEVNQLIFVGKSKHIRRRIDQHLKNTKSKKGLELLKEIVRIEYELTGSDLIASFVELNLIAQTKPIFNAPFKKTKFTYGLFHYIDDIGYIRFFIGLCSKLSEKPLMGYVTKNEGVTHLLALIEQFELCQKLCDLYPTNSNCFDFSVGKCQGACVKQESPYDYNLKANSMISDVVLAKQNFYIIEPGRQKGEKSIVLFEDGEIKAYGFTPFHFQFNSINKWRHTLNDFSGAYDSFTIFRNYIKSKPSLSINYF